MDNNEQFNQEQVQQPVINVNAGPVIPEEYKPISAWGYFGYQLLFAIPCVGFILLCVFALGGTKNINLKNFARSYFCIYLLIAIIVGILLLFGVSFSFFSNIRS